MPVEFSRKSLGIHSPLRVPDNPRSLSLPAHQFEFERVVLEHEVGGLDGGVPEAEAATAVDQIAKQLRRNLDRRFTGLQSDFGDTMLQTFGWPLFTHGIPPGEHCSGAQHWQSLTGMGVRSPVQR